MPEDSGSRGRPGRSDDGPATAFERDLLSLRRRLIRSSNIAIDMLETSLHGLREVDHEVARAVRRRDDSIDNEEVLIEEACLKLMTLQQPYGQDFRQLAFCLKVNQDIERVADHAAVNCEDHVRV